MHYAPIAETCGGERDVILPFLGTSRLSAPCEAFGALGIFHGHAHHGRTEGRTPKGIPVFNVAIPVLKKAWDLRFRLFDLTDEACVAVTPKGPQPVPVAIH
ncbi:MAG TPA: metallophosphoesterase, partial [Anaeromyxobacteraceae bacterium]|nr:metallophosphoesterase [Anaeromyxobacteraceae bacterium]